MCTKTLVVFAVILVLLDSIWLMGASDLHKQMVQDVHGLKDGSIKFNKLAAVLFYVLAAVSYVFIVRKLAKSEKDALLYGALLGAAMYFTFDLTNKAIFEKYTWSYAIQDGLWGTMVMGIASYLTYKAVKN